MAERKIPEVYSPLFDGALGGDRWYALGWGGRSAGRSVQFAAGFATDASKLPQGCVALAARQTYKSLDDSSKAELEAILIELGIPFDSTVSEIRFPGGGKIIFLQMSDISQIKSIKNLCMVWVEESQFVTKIENIRQTVNTIRIPQYARDIGIEPRFYATMNRIDPNDAMWDFFEALPNEKKLLIYATIFDNPYAPPTMVDQERIDRQAMIEGKQGAMTRDQYNLEWLGLPSNNADDGVYNYEDLLAAKDTYNDDVLAIVAGQDLAYGGTDSCVYVELGIHRDGHRSILRVERWQARSKDETVGRIVGLNTEDKPKVIFVDAGDGEGVDVVKKLVNAGLTNVSRFIPGIELKMGASFPTNIRAQATFALADRFKQGKIHGLTRAFIEDLKGIKKKRQSEKGWRIEPKDDYRKRIGRSPDYADALMIANYAADKVETGILYEASALNIRDRMNRPRQTGVRGPGGITILTGGGRFGKNG